MRMRPCLPPPTGLTYRTPFPVPADARDPPDENPISSRAHDARAVPSTDKLLPEVADLRKPPSVQSIRAMHPFLLRKRLDDTMNTIIRTVKDRYAKVSRLKTPSNKYC